MESAHIDEISPTNEEGEPLSCDLLNGEIRHLTSLLKSNEPKGVSLSIPQNDILAERETWIHPNPETIDMGRPFEGRRRFLLRFLSTAVLSLTVVLSSDAQEGTSDPSSSDGPSSSSRIARYTLRLASTTPPEVEVIVEADGSPSGSTVWTCLEHWGGHEDLGKGIHDLIVRNANGEILPIDDVNPFTWQTPHPPGERIRASYRLRTAADQIPLEFGRHYRPHLTEDLFHLIGNTGLIVPEHLDDSLPCDVRLNFEGFKEKGWTSVSSFGSGDSETRIPISLEKFRHALFLAGKIRLHTLQMRGGIVQVALYGDDWGFEDSEFTSLTEKIIKAERSFFSDFETPYFLVSAIPVGVRHEHSKENPSLGGTGLTHCFSMFLTPGMSLDRGSKEEVAIKRLLAHEYFHNWNGTKIERTDPEQLVYWFSEGFTDFYARRLLYRAGLYDDREYLADLNDSIHRYTTSEARNASNEEILAHFWTDRTFSDLPYRRGDLIALVLDREIRRLSEDDKSLDDLMRELVAHCSRTGEKISTEMMLEWFSRSTSPDFAKRLEGVIRRGEPLQLPNRLTNPDLELASHSVPRFALGFDLEASQADRTITGLDPESAAFEAGLRDGQKILGWSIHHGDVEQPVVVTARVGRRERNFRYLPVGKILEVPFYRSASASR